MGRNLLSLAGLAAVALCLVSMWRHAANSRATRSEPDLDHEQLARAVAHVDPVVELAAVPHIAADATPELAAAERQALASLESARRLVAPDGSAVEGAELSWTTLIDDDLGPHGTWDAVPWEAVDAVTVWSRSDERGQFRFSAEPPGAREAGSVIWITHPKFVARRVLLDAGASPWSSDEPLVLEPSGGLRVRVVDGEEQPVAGALVQHVGLGPPSALRHDERERRAVRLFHRERVTDSAGYASLAFAPIRGNQALACAHGGLAARPWQGDELKRELEITLKLLPTFTLSGRVSFGEAVAAAELPSISVDANAGGLGHNLGRFAVRVDGTFGPVQIAVIDADEYQIDVAGGPWQPEVSVELVPDPGDALRVEFTLERGIDVMVDVHGVDDDPIAGADVRIAWWFGECELAVGCTASTNEAGRARVRGCRSGTVSLSVGAKGFASLLLRDVSIPADDGEPFEIELERGGELAGRVVHAGEPVSDFAVAYWRQNPHFDGSTRYFQGRADGSFEVENASLGTLHVVAWSDRFARSDAVIVDVGASRGQPVTIELAEPIVGRGRFVDALTAAPLAEAWIDLYANYGAWMLARFGPRHVADAQGEFEILGFAPGETRFWAGAPGYSNWIGKAVARPGEVLDVGTIALSPQQPLEVRLTGAGSRDCSAFSISGRSTRDLPVTRFTAGGLARFERADAGLYHFDITGDDGSLRYLQHHFVAGRDWLLEVPIGGARELAVEVEPADGASLPEPCYVDAWSVLPSGRKTCSSATVVERVARFADLQGDVAVLECYGEDGATLALDRVELTGGSTHIKLRLGARSVRLRVVDDAHRPIAGIGAGVMVAGTWHLYLNADSDGVVVLPHVAVPSVSVELHDPDSGSSYHEVDLAGHRDDPIELRHAPDARVRLRLLDGNQPLAHTPAWLWGAGNFEMGNVVTDASGYAESRFVAEGNAIAIEIDGPGLWAAAATLKSTRHGAPDVVQVRRTGVLALSVRDVSGAVVASELIELVSLELGASVATWIAGGRVRTSTNGLASDAQGELVLSGLPRGDYRWRVADADSGTREGTVTVAPRAVTQLAITLP